MDKKFLNYTEWQNTADLVHLLLQMVGKVKLERCHKRPEWAHVRLYMTLDGLSSGIIPCSTSPFEIFVNLRKHQIEIHNEEGKSRTLPLEDGTSIAVYYHQFMDALEQIGAATEINIKPQEFYDPIPFDQDRKHHHYDKAAVELWLQNLLFAYGAMRQFLSGFRGKVDGPAYYFGTMDLTCIVYSGESAPFGMNKSISDHAFDERYFECGFWPGDVNYGKPAFYGLPYPFIEDIQGHDDMLHPDKAFFLPAKKEFFLNLEDVFSYSDPANAVVQFCNSGLTIFNKLSPWKNYDWITTPLSYSK